MYVCIIDVWIGDIDIFTYVGMGVCKKSDMGRWGEGIPLNRGSKIFLVYRYPSDTGNLFYNLLQILKAFFDTGNLFYNLLQILEAFYIQVSLRYWKPFLHMSLPQTLDTFYIQVSFDIESPRTHLLPQC